MNLAGYLRIFVLLMIAFHGTAGTASARPPSEMNLSYDAPARNLHIEIRHVSINPRKHFIRRLLVYKNDEEVEKRAYVQQTTAAMLIEDVPLEAATGDVVRVEAVCNQAGRKDATLMIP